MYVCTKEYSYVPKIAPSKYFVWLLASPAFTGGTMPWAGGQRGCVWLSSETLMHSLNRNFGSNIVTFPSDCYDCANCSSRVGEQGVAGGGLSSLQLNAILEFCPSHIPAGARP